MKQAHAFGDEIVGGAAAMDKFLPTSGIHRPPTKRRKVKNTTKIAPSAPISSNSQPVAAHVTSDVQRQPKRKRITKRINPANPSTDAPSKAVSSNCVPSNCDASCDVSSHCVLPSSCVPCDSSEMFHVTLRIAHPMVKKCYGCERAIKCGHDILLEHFCHRQFYKKSSGTRCVTPMKTAAYFHLNLQCVRKIKATMELCHVLVHDEVRAKLTADQVQNLKKFGLNL